MNIKKDPEDEQDDEPNSKEIIQEDLEELYEGDIFKGEKTYSRMMSILMVCLTYSSGMPIIYFVGFMYFFITFIVNKLMLIKFFQKTNALSRVIPNFSVKFLNVAILIHMTFGIVMFTNHELFQCRVLPEHDFPKFEFLFGKAATLEELESMEPLEKFFKERVMYFHQ